MTELTPNPFAAPQTRERMANIAKGIGTFAFESLPGVSEYVTYKDIREELGKPKPNPYVIAGLGAAGIAGLIPGLGDLAAKGGRKIVDFAKRIEADPNTLGMSGGNLRLREGTSLFSPESKQGRQLLIVSCSDKKCPDVGDMKALDRYTGQLFSKMKAFGIPPKVDVAILSAKHGLIRSDTPIENYDQIMTDEIRDKFLKDPNELKKIRDTMSGDYDKVIVTGGPNYRSIIDAAAKDINYEVVSEKAPGLTQEAVVQRLRRKKFEKEIALQKQFEGPENFEKDITAYHYTFPGQGKFNTNDIKKFDMDVVQARNKGYSVKYADTLGLHVGSENAARDRFFGYADLDPETVGKDPEKLAPGATYPLKIDTRKPFLNPNSEDGLWGEIELENFLYEEFLKDPKFKDIVEDNLSGGAFTYPAGAQTERARELTKQIRKKLAKDGFTNIPYKNDIEGGVRGRYGGIEQKEISHIMLIDRPNPKSKVVKSKITAEPMEEGGVAGLSDIARDMFKGPKGIGAYQPFMVG